MDDNLVDFAACWGDAEKNDASCFELIDIGPIIDNLFTNKQLDTIASVFFITGRPLGSDKHELYLKEKKYVKDDVITLDKNIIMRTYDPTNIDIYECTYSSFGDRSCINPHRPKIMFLNCKMTKDKGLNYNMALKIGEDINFTKNIVSNNMKTAILNIKYITLPDERRPRLDIYGNDNKPETYRFLTDTEINAINDSYLCEIMADTIMYKGRIIFFGNDGICGMSGVYGPYRLITKYDYDLIKTQLSDNYHIDDIVGTAYIDENKKYNSLYLRPNAFFFKLNNLTLKWRLNNAIKYITNPNNIEDVVIKNFKSTFLYTYDMASLENDSLYKTSGMSKYILQYEYLDKYILHNFKKMCRNTFFSKFIFDIFSKIITKKQNNSVLIDDLNIYIYNYPKNPSLIHKILVILILYIRTNKIIDTIETETKMPIRKFEQFVMIMGGCRPVVFRKYDIYDSLDEIILFILNNVKLENGEAHFVNTNINTLKSIVNNLFQKIF